MEIFRSISPESDDVAIGQESLADAERLNKDYSAAERNYREALRIAKKTKNDDIVASLTGNLAELALDREQWAEAESLAREALALAEKVGRHELIALDCHTLAKALLKQNPVGAGVGADRDPPLQEALTLSRRAVEIFSHLRVPDDLQEAQETLAEIEEKLKEK